jgi:septum formation protein
MVLSADTAVVLKEQILHKPTSYDDARGMLEALSGQTHEVMTFVVLMCDAIVETQMVNTSVQFGELEPTIIDYYLSTDEPWDKAGAYGIQGFAGCFVTRLEGSYSGVVGLPLHETDALLRTVGLGRGIHGSHV